MFSLSCASVVDAATSNSSTTRLSRPSSSSTAERITATRRSGTALRGEKTS